MGPVPDAETGVSGNPAGKQLIQDLEGWLKGMDRFILHLEHTGAQGK
jgi:hypothetical protein